MKRNDMTVAVAATVLALSMAMSVRAQAGEDKGFDAATQRAMYARSGKTRPLRGQWVYRIVERWAPHVEETYGTPMRRWAEAMASRFADASLPQLQRAAEARSFAAMNDALLNGGGARSMGATTAVNRAPPTAKALGDIDKDLVYVPVTPCRILDTRVVGGPITANSFRDFDLTDVVRFASQGGDTSNCGVGDKGSFAAAAVNFTVVQPSGAGYMTAFPYLASQPTAATMNYAAGDIRNGLAIVRLDQTPAVYEFSVYSFAQTHLVADIVGYFREPEATAVECFNTSATQALSNGIPFFLDANSCPAGYAAVSGACRSDSYENPVYLMGSYTDSSRHHCQFYNYVVGRSVSAYTRCCRTPGR